MSVSNIILNIITQGNQAAADGLKNVQVAITAVGASFVAAGKSLSDFAAKFEVSMRNVASLTALTEKEFQKLSESVKDLSVMDGIADSAASLANGLYDLVSSGFDVADSLKIVGVASRAASAGLTSTEVSVKALSAVMNSYNNKSLQASIEYSDDLFQIVNKGVITFEQLATNLGSVLPVANAAKISFKEVGASYIELTKAGISASESQTAIASLFRMIAAAGPEAQQAAKDMGLDLKKSFSESALSTQGFASVLTDLSKATGGSLELMRKLIPDATAANAALILSADGATKYKESLKAMNKDGGAASTALNEQTKSFEFQTKKLSGELDNLKITFGALVQQAITPFIAKIREAINFITAIDEETKKSIVEWALFAVKVSAVATTVSGLIISINLLVSGFVALKGSILALSVMASPAIMTLSNSLFGLAGTTTLVGGAVASAFATISASLIVVTASIAALYGLYKTGEAFIGMLDAKSKAKTDEVNLKKTKDAAFDLVKAYSKLSQSEKDALSVDKLRDYSKAFAGMITFVNGADSKSYHKRMAINLEEQAKLKQKIDTETAKSDKENSKKQSEEAVKNYEKNKELAKKKEESEKEAKRKADKLRSDLLEKQKQSDNDYKQFQAQITDEILKIKLSAMAYEIKQAEIKRDKLLAIARNEQDKKNITIVFSKEKQDILNKYAEIENQKNQEIARRSQKINEDITNYVKDETQKRKAIEEKQQEELNKIALENYQRKQKQDKEALEDSLKLGEDETKAFEEQMQSFIEDENNSLNERLSLLDDFINYKKIKYGEDSKEYKSAAKQKLDTEKELQAKQKQAINSFYSDITSSAVSIGSILKDTSNDLISSVGSLIEKTGEGFNSFLNMSNQLGNIQKDLASGKIDEITAKFQTMSSGVEASIKVITDSLQNIFSYFDKQSNAIEKYKKAYNDFGADSQEVKDAILEMNEGVSDSFKNLPGIIGEPLSKLARMFTDFIGFTESVAEKTRKALDAENFKKLVDETLKIGKKIVDSSNELNQLNIDIIEDEKTRKEEQLKNDIKLVNQSEDIEAVKIAKIKKLNYDYNTWLNEFNQKAIDKETSEKEDSLKKIQSINEANYKSELSILDKVYGEKRRKLEGEVQKEIDIIQSKNDRLKAIDDERNQTDADKKKRLQSFNQSLSSNKRTADFYRANPLDFETGAIGNSNQRKQLEAEYQKGAIDYETYAKKRTEIGLKQYQYYIEQSKNIVDPNEKQDILDKAYQGQQEYYDFIFDKEKEKIENETKQAETRLKTKRTELDKITELEKTEIAKLDQAYKDSSGLYRDSFVEATKVWVKFAQDSVNNIDLSNLINKVKNDVSQNKTEALKVPVKSGIQSNQIPGASNTGVNVPIKSGYSTGGNVGPLLPDGKFYSKDSSFNTSKSAESEQQKKNKLISKLVVNPMFDVPFDNFINQSLSWLENQAIRLGIPLMANGGVTKGLSIAGERGAEAIFNYGDMKGMYDFVKRTAISPNNSTNNYNQTPINITYSPVFTGVDLSKTGQVNEMIKSNFDTLKKDIIKAQGGR